MQCLTFQSNYLFVYTPPPARQNLSTELLLYSRVGRLRRAGGSVHPLTSLASPSYSSRMRSSPFTLHFTLHASHGQLLTPHITITHTHTHTHAHTRTRIHTYIHTHTHTHTHTFTVLPLKLLMIPPQVARGRPNRITEDRSLLFHRSTHAHHRAKDHANSNS
jgi:hypothetical protein